MGDVFIRVRARHELSINPFDERPAPTPVIWRADNEQTIRRQHANQLLAPNRIVWDMLDHLGADHAIKLLVLERQGKKTTDRRRLTIAAQVAHLVQLNVNPDRIREIQEYPARSAAHVESPRGPFGESRENLEPLSLPVALRRDQAVVGAPVIVATTHGITELPHTNEGDQHANPELDDLRVRGSLP